MKISFEGRVIYDGALVPIEEVAAASGVAVEEVTVEYTALEQRDAIRRAISAQAGDTLSLLGTASDGAQLLLFHMATLVKGLSTANSLAEVRDATDAFMPLADAFLGKVAAGEVKLPFQLKGEAAVMTEIETRATAVADALIHAQKGG